MYWLLHISDTVIFSFVTDAANVILTPSPGAPEGFLELRVAALDTYNVALVKGVNLNVLNPRPSPVSIPSSDH